MPDMDRRIFEMGLSVEATSLYLLMESLSDSGVSLNRASVLPYWNATEQELDEAFDELLRRNVVSVGVNGTWMTRPSSEWHWEGG